jgi:hypothetical protein
MDSSKVVNFQRGRIPAGLKALVIVIALGTIALVADHSFFIAPHTAQATSVPLYLPANMQTDGFALPADMHPTQADVGTPPPSF